MELEDIIQGGTGARAARSDISRQCTATSKETGQRCKRFAILGGFVCPMHGGSIPVVKQKAQERLLAMCEPALNVLLRMLTTGPTCEHCGRSDDDRSPVVLAAAKAVLDRCGFSPQMKLEVSTPNPFADMPLAEMADQLEAFAREARVAADEEARLLRLADGIVEGVVVKENGQ